jgi:hypothetical protein
MPRRVDLLLRAFTVSGGTLAVVALLVLGVSGGLGTDKSVATGSRTYTAPQVPPPPSPPEAAGAAPAAPKLLEGETRTTLQGDDINDAIATYGIDEGGNLYEVHSPQTEVPSLGGPSA